MFQLVNLTYITIQLARNSQSGHSANNKNSKQLTSMKFKEL